MVDSLFILPCQHLRVSPVPIEMFKSAIQAAIQWHLELLLPPLEFGELDIPPIGNKERDSDWSD
jgi:hypothetical protein